MLIRNPVFRVKVAIVLSGALLLSMQTASAQGRFFGGFGFGIGNFLFHPYFAPSYRSYSHSYGGGGGGGGRARTHGHTYGTVAAKPANRAQEVALASLGANKDYDNILREVTFKTVEASAGSDDSQKFGHKGDALNAKVDLPTELAAFVDEIQQMSKQVTAVGDVSLAATEAALNEVYEAREQETSKIRDPAGRERRAGKLQGRDRARSATKARQILQRQQSRHGATQPDQTNIRRIRA